jgi:thermostable 8-oxoguanine DNA glycosylase
MVGSSLGMDIAELKRLVELYDLETYLFETVSKEFKQKQTLTTFEFFAIITWKSNRSKTKVRDGLAAAGKSASDLMKSVSRAEKTEAKVETLRRIGGIGLPIASAILAVCYPDEFTVLDIRAWTTLREVSTETLPSRYPQDSGDYLQYCQVCRDLANEAGLSLRNLDRGLWAKNWEDNLCAFIMKKA